MRHNPAVLMQQSQLHRCREAAQSVFLCVVHMCCCQVGAHGTGARIPSVEEQVVSMRLVTPALGTLTLSKDKEPELFQLAKVGLGALGVVSQVSKDSCVPCVGGWGPGCLCSYIGLQACQHCRESRLEWRMAVPGCFSMHASHVPQSCARSGCCR